MSHLIAPHGGELVDLVVGGEQAEELKNQSQDWPSWDLSARQMCDIELLLNGAFSPLRGFMNRADYESVCTTMRLADSTVWPIPITLAVSEEFAGSLSSGDKVALRDPEGVMLAVLNVEDIWKADKQAEAAGVYGTEDTFHKGVAYLLNDTPDWYVGGEVQGVQLPFHYDSRSLRLSPKGIRREFDRFGWRKVIAFQTRNPMHRAHEELCKIARDAVSADGVLIHMLLGKLKPGDIPASVRDAAIRKMVELYFPPNSVMVTGYGFDMLYAGPREAVLHAIFRQNAGCTHLIVGRDHAGVGDFYGAFDAQAIFEEQVPEGVLEIEIFKADHTAYSKKLDQVVMMRDVSDHQEDDFVLLSGTRVREMLLAGEPLPPEFARPEVGKILMDHYQAG